MTDLRSGDIAHGIVARSAARGAPLFLASVRDAAEACVVRHHGADIVDAKEPSAGSLGAVSGETLRAIRSAVGADTLISATIGDAVLSADALAGAVADTRDAGADVVKIGLFAGTAWQSVRHLADHVCLAAVVLADQTPPFKELAQIQAAGFSIVLLDTADKQKGALPDLVSLPELTAFVSAAQRLGLTVGLAGALRTRHIAPLKALGPHLMGFRGALTGLEQRTRKIDAVATADIALHVKAAGGDHRVGSPASSATPICTPADAEEPLRE